jgi:hypothetical protein
VVQRRDAAPGEPLPTTAALPLASLGAGQFSLRVSSGADKVAFDGGGAALQGEDLKTATLKTLAPSAKADDVHVEIEHAPPGAKKLAKAASVDLTVRAPDHLQLLGTEDRADGAHGYNSVTSLRVFDNLNQPMPFIDTNEDFTVGTLEQHVKSSAGGDAERCCASARSTVVEDGDGSGLRSGPRKYVALARSQIPRGVAGGRVCAAPKLSLSAFCLSMRDTRQFVEELLMTSSSKPTEAMVDARPSRRAGRIDQGADVYSSGSEPKAGDS